jgi:PTH2 family peptidyl-tRNA hydrolase
MPPGKLAAQAGHAYLDSFLIAQTRQPDVAAAYAAPGQGTKVTLAARSLNALLRAAADAAESGLAHALITDSGHVLPPHFDGSPVVTALGLGPATREEVEHITRRFRLI